jgi:hypothetical protein
MTDRAIQLLAEIVVDVRGPANTLQTGGPAGYPYDEDEEGSEEFTEDEQEEWEPEEWVGSDDDYDDVHYEADIFGDITLLARYSVRS